MTTSVTAPLEKQFGQMPGLNEMSSISSAGSSVITLQFDLNLSLDVAEQEVQAAINAVRQSAAQPAAGAADLCQGQSGRRAGDHLGGQLHQPASHYGRGTGRHPHRPEDFPAYGVGLVSIAGGQRPAVRIQANLQKLAALGLNIDDLRTTIANNNSNAPKGSFDGATQSYTINANDQLSERRGLQEDRRRLQERRAGLSARCRQRPAGRGERQAVQLGQQGPRHPDQCPAPARRQRHPGGGFHQGALAPDPGRPAGARWT